MPTPKAGFSKGLREISEDRIKTLGKLKDTGPFEEEGSGITKEIAEKTVNGILGSVFTNNLESYNNQEFNTHINTLLNIITNKTKSEGRFSEKLQSNYKSTLENTQTGNIKIIKSEYMYLENRIELAIEYKGKNIRLSREVDIKNIEHLSIYIGGILYRLEPKENTYTSSLSSSNKLPQDDIKILKELQAEEDLFKDLEGRENIPYGKQEIKNGLSENINTVLGPSPYTELNPE